MTVHVSDTIIEPRAKALSRAVESVNSAIQTPLQTGVSTITVYAIAKDVYIHWAETDVDACTTLNFDEVVPAGTMIRLGIPDGNITHISTLGRESGATAVIIQK